MSELQTYKLIFENSPVPVAMADLKFVGNCLADWNVADKSQLVQCFSDKARIKKLCNSLIWELVNSSFLSAFGFNSRNEFDSLFHSFMTENLRDFCITGISAPACVLKSFSAEMSIAFPGKTLKCFLVDCVIVFENNESSAKLTFFLSDNTDKKHSEFALSKFYKAEEIGSSISSKFLNVSLDCVEGEIEKALSAIGSYYKADFCNFIMLTDSLSIKEVFEWSSDKTLFRKSEIMQANLLKLPYTLRKMRENLMVYISDVSVSNPEAEIDAEYFKKNNFKSVLIVPVFLEGKFSGMIYMLTRERTIEFEYQKIALMRMVGEDILKLIHRKIYVENIRKSEEQYRVIAKENADLLKQAMKTSQLNEKLLQEVNHRVKNNLASLIGLLSIEMDFLDRKNRKVPHQMLERVRIRIETLSAIHNLLSKSQWQAVEVAEIARHVFIESHKSLMPKKRAYFDISESSVKVSSKQAVALSFIFNEVFSNSIFHVLKKQDIVNIYLQIEIGNGLAKLIISDDGSGFPDDVVSASPETCDVGLYLINILIQHELKGEFSLYNNNGANVRIVFQPQAEDDVIRVI
ncbi:MAG: hypothetical protein HQM10_19490 [Candidatus Riflebacteria bacterium]|nr:hypothetical protein [Candidatus Riflebacteria bacterium]